jgi:hypothetical protein
VPYCAGAIVGGTGSAISVRTGGVVELRQCYRFVGYAVAKRTSCSRYGNAAAFAKHAHSVALPEGPKTTHFGSPLEVLSAYTENTRAGAV